MRIRFLLFCFVISMLRVNSQIEYSFDTLLLYSTSSYKDSLQEKKQIVLANSNDNSFFAHLFEKDSTTFSFYFRDYNKLNFNTKLKRQDFIRTQSISVDCNGISTWTKDQHKKELRKVTKKLKMIQLKDTIINSVDFKHFRVRDNRKRMLKKEKYSYRYYIIDKSFKAMQPVITDHFDNFLWKNEGYMDVGSVKEFGNYNTEKGLIFTSKLDTIIKIDKKVIVPGNCTKNVNLILLRN